MENKEQRLERMNKELIPVFKEEFALIKQEMESYFNSNQDLVIGSFIESINKGIEQCHTLQQTSKKQSICHIHFSYLLNSALTNQFLIKIDFYDNRHFYDLSEIDVYWDYTFIIPSIEEKMKAIKTYLIKGFQPVKNYEIEHLKLYFQTGYFMALESILHKIYENQQFQIQIVTKIPNEVSIYFGAYLSESILLGKIGGENNEILLS